MLLLSLGAEAIATLLRDDRCGALSGPDLTWLLFGPDMAAADFVEPEKAALT